MPQEKRVKSQIISISLPASLKKDLYAYANKTDIPVSQLAKEAFRVYLVTDQLERINKGFRNAALKLEQIL